MRASAWLAAAAAGLAASLLVGCGDDNGQSSADNSQVFNQQETGIAVGAATGGVEVADGFYLRQDGTGNTLLVDATTGEAWHYPVTAISQSGSNNVTVVYLRPVIEEVPEEEAEDKTE